MQAIITKFLGPTNTRGARIKATAWAGSVTVPFDYSLDTVSNHKAAAQALCDNRGDGWRIVDYINLQDGKSYAFAAKKPD